jgi:HSP20 family protein
MKSLVFPTRFPAHAGNGRARFDGSPFFDFHREMDQLLDNAFAGFGFNRTRNTLPTVEVQEAEKEYRVTVDLPGVDLKDIELSFSEGMLTIKAQRRADEGQSLYSDRWNGGFERVIGVDTAIEESQIGATLKNGVLTVTLPRKPERLPRRIEIQ